MKTLQKHKNPKHLAFIRALPCVITLKKPVQAAHIRIGGLAGIGRKPTDCDVLPLSWKEHAKQHKIGELKYWYEYGGHEKAKMLANEIYKVSGDYAAAIKLIMEWRNGVFFN